MQTKYQKLYDNEKNKEKQHATPPAKIVKR